ncbi:MAG: hypothetical protein C3F18_10530 [Nitrosomonadales bacterium]|nr:MAG: hypothetical protein C3F18_10530 [Nitrosomonadales bacterium]
MQLNKMVVVLAGLAVPGVSFATNGMNMEGYGPISLGMGGASMAYDNGTAAMMNNPATLGLMGEGRRVDLALGYMGPDVTAKAGAATAPSAADAFGGPAFGWVTKSGRLTYGLGMYGQGGMGAEYAADSFMGNGQNLPTRSELGVGRLLFPLAFNVSPDLTIGGSFDFVWAGLDVQMFDQGGGYIESTNGNDFSGKAHATGYAAKIGLVYKVNPQLSAGAAYHSETNLGDLEADGAQYTAGGMTYTGKFKAVDFQWPETYGVGLSYQASDKLLIAADYKRINWGSVMKNFHMTFSSAGMSWDALMPQNWKDQDVWMLGFTYQATDALILRAGINIADNPVPGYYMHPLFPATIKNHYTAGFGYRFSKASSIDFAYSHAPEVTLTNGYGITVSHGQNNAQFIYSYRY